jgi:hypothetical protein
MAPVNGRTLTKQETLVLYEVLDGPDDELVAALHHAVAVVLGEPAELSWAHLLSVAAASRRWSQRRIDMLLATERTWLEDLTLELCEVRGLEMANREPLSESHVETSEFIRIALDALRRLNPHDVRRASLALREADAEHSWFELTLLLDMASDQLAAGKSLSESLVLRISDVLGPGPFAAMVELVPREAPTEAEGY